MVFWCCVLVWCPGAVLCSGMVFTYTAPFLRSGIVLRNCVRVWCSGDKRGAGGSAWLGLALVTRAVSVSGYRVAFVARMDARAGRTCTGAFEFRGGGQRRREGAGEGGSGGAGGVGIEGEVPA